MRLAVFVGSVEQCVSQIGARTALLCIPCPGCADRIGCEVGKRRGGKFGDQVQAATVEGNNWRKRYDSIKVQWEVFNLFAHLIPQQGLSRIERGRKRQGGGWSLNFSWGLRGRGV